MVNATASSKTEKEVKERVAHLNIQVENMCTFLPQASVSSPPPVTTRGAEVLEPRMENDVHCSM